MGNSLAFLVVFVGAGLGGAARHAVNLLAARLPGLGFPYGTLTVNVVGSLLMGLLTEFFVARSHMPLEARLFLTTGILGGFTTFSTFSLDAVLLWERGQWAISAGYIAGSLILSIGALAAGMAVIRLLAQNHFL